MKKANTDIREKVASCGLRMWQLADALGMADTTLCRKMRKELSREEKNRIFTVIAELSQEVC